MNVLPVSFNDVYDWIKRKHYAHRMPSITHAFGLYEEKNLVGVVTYGTPCSSTLLRGVCGDQWSKNVLELNRLVIECNDKNSASLLIAGSIRLLPKPSIIVSYADTKQGHIGYVYQATNFIYTGLSAKFTDPKVIGLEHQHHGTYANGMSNKDLLEKYGDKLYYEERARKHRYIYFQGTRKQKREMLADLKYPILPYPKGESKRYDASYKPVTQQILFDMIGGK